MVQNCKVKASLPNPDSSCLECAIACLLVFWLNDQYVRGMILKSVKKLSLSPHLRKP